VEHSFRRAAPANWRTPQGIRRARRLPATLHRGRWPFSRLRQWKSNGAIACELNLSESTFMAHVGNLMQKLNAANRT
jgi:FixJ family two-component response regulator